MLPSSNDATKNVNPAYNNLSAENNFSMGWLSVLLVLLLLAGLVMYFIAGAATGFVADFVNNDSVVASAPQAAPAATVNTRKPVSIRLSDSVAITAYKNGIENKLLLYIMSKNAADSIDKTRWFYFDDVNFKPVSAVITNASMHQVKNIAMILCVYPKVKISIGSYINNDDAANMQLAAMRSKTIEQALRNAGVNNAQLSVASAIVDDGNNTKESMAINVLAK